MNLKKNVSYLFTFSVLIGISQTVWGDIIRLPPNVNVMPMLAKYNPVQSNLVPPPFEPTMPIEQDQSVFHLPEDGDLTKCVILHGAKSCGLSLQQKIDAKPVVKTDIQVDDPMLDKKMDCMLKGYNNC